jgi:hypothetical protein
MRRLTSRDVNLPCEVFFGEISGDDEDIFSSRDVGDADRNTIVSYNEISGYSTMKVARISVLTIPARPVDTNSFACNGVTMCQKGGFFSKLKANPGVDLKKEEMLLTVAC